MVLRYVDVSGTKPIEIKRREMGGGGDDKRKLKGKNYNSLFYQRMKEKKMHLSLDSNGHSKPLIGI